MIIYINGKSYETSCNNLDLLLKEINKSQPWIATAVNGKHIPTDNRKDCKLKADDKIEILTLL